MAPSLVAARLAFIFQHSAAVVEEQLRAASDDTGLHATAIELCSARWDSSLAARWDRSPSLKRTLSLDEFQVAYETAIECGLQDVVLADQPIEQTGHRLAAALKRAVSDCFTPDGWRHIGTDVCAALEQLPTFATGVCDSRIALVRLKPPCTRLPLRDPVLCALWRACRGADGGWIDSYFAAGYAARVGTLYLPESGSPPILRCRRRRIGCSRRLR